MADSWVLVTPTGEYQLNPTFRAPKYQPGDVDGAGIIRSANRSIILRSGDGLATPGPLELTGNVWRDDRAAELIAVELNEIREAVATCRSVIRGTAAGDYVYDGLNGGPPPTVIPDGLGGWTVEIELWPSTAEPTLIPRRDGWYTDFTDVDDWTLIKGAGTSPPRSPLLPGGFIGFPPNTGVTGGVISSSEWWAWTTPDADMENLRIRVAYDLQRQGSEEADVVIVARAGTGPVNGYTLAYQSSTQSLILYRTERISGATATLQVVTDIDDLGLMRLHVLEGAEGTVIRGAMGTGAWDIETLDDNTARPLQGRVAIGPGNYLGASSGNPGTRLQFLEAELNY